MLIRRAIDHVKNQNWAALVSELIIVVVGIFIAIQADRWWQQQDDLQQEKLYIARLTNDVEHDITAIEYAKSLATYRLSLSNLLIEAAIEPEVARQQPIDFMTAIQQSSFTYTPSLNTDTFEELRATGSLGLLRDEALRSALFEYYRYDTGQRQYLSLQLMTEFRHLELAAGILTNEQYIWIQDEMGYVSSSTRLNVEITPVQLDALVIAAQRLQESREFVAWLPESRSLQLELIDTHKRRLTRANALFKLLQSK